MQDINWHSGAYYFLGVPNLLKSISAKSSYSQSWFGQKIIVKISRNKWFTSLLLFEIERSNAWGPIKIPTLGIYVSVKFPWFADPPHPLGLDIDRCITIPFPNRLEKNQLFPHRSLAIWMKLYINIKTYSPKNETEKKGKKACRYNM